MACDGNERLRNAAAAGDLRAVAGELDAGGSADGAGDDGLTALHMAAGGGYVEIVRYLLDEHGAAIDQRAKDGRTPLHLSVSCGDLDTVQTLLSREADPNCQMVSGDTPLHLAAQLPRPDVAHILLLHRADPRATNNQGDTPLHMAASHARVAHVQLLLDEGAFADAQNQIAMSPLWMVCENGPWIEEQEAQTAECAALFAQSNELMLARQYAEAEKMLLASNNLQVDPVESRDCCKVASMLLQRGADVNCADTAVGDTPLTVAAAQASVAYQDFLRAHPPPKKPDKKPSEPEAEVVEEAEPGCGFRVKVQLDLILMLLKAGAKYEHVNRAGHSALSLTPELPAVQAVLLGKPKADEDLLSAAAAGIMASAREARDNGASLLKTLSRGTSTALHVAASFGRVRTDPQKPPKASGMMVKFLLDEGADINVARDGDKLTPLCMAAQAGHNQIVQLLLQRGAARDYPTHRGLTALWYAARNGHADVAEILLHGSCTDACDEHCKKRHVGCRVDRVNADGISPLWIAAASGHVDVVRVLLLHHAEIDRTDKSGSTPIWMACKRGHEAVAQLLARGLGTNHHIDVGKSTKLQQTHTRANVDRSFEGGLTPRWVANKRHQWNTSAWPAAEPELELLAADSRQEAAPKKQENMTLELGRRNIDAHRSDNKPAVNGYRSEITLREAAHVEDTRRGWTSHRRNRSSDTPQQNHALNEAFRAEGYAAIVNSLPDEDAECLKDFYIARASKSAN